MPVRKDPEVAQWVQFGTDGSLPIRELNGKSDYGSSFASARIAGILASIDAANPIKDASDARSRLNEFTQDRKSVVSGKSVSVRVDLGGRRIIKKKQHIDNTLHNKQSHK